MTPDDPPATGLEDAEHRWWPPFHLRSLRLGFPPRVPAAGSHRVLQKFRGQEAGCREQAGYVDASPIQAAASRCTTVFVLHGSRRLDHSGSEGRGFVRGTSLGIDVHRRVYAEIRTPERVCFYTVRRGSTTQRERSRSSCQGWHASARPSEEKYGPIAFSKTVSASRRQAAHRISDNESTNGRVSYVWSTAWSHRRAEKRCAGKSNSRLGGCCCVFFPDRCPS